MQETFLALIRGLDRYEPKALVRTYLYGIAMKVLSTERRKIGRAATETPASHSDAMDEVLWVRQALHRLDPSDREILMLREYEQLSYSEIAEVLRLPLNTVRSRLFRARLELRSYLEPTRNVAPSSVSEV